MAIVANTYTKYEAKGQRESLHDRIYNISPEETPFITGAGRGPNSKAVLEEWQTDSLAAADGTNAQLEGDDITAFDAVTPTVRVGNVNQIMRKTLILSDTLEVVDKAGRRSELAYQLAMRGAEIKRDLETVCLRAQAGESGSTSVARTLAALNAWLKTNTDFGAGGADPSYTSGVPGAVRTDGTPRVFTETIGKAVIESGWNEGATFPVIMVGSFNKQQISATWSGIATQNYDLSNVAPRPTAAIGSIDVYVSDFGVHRIVPNRFQRGRDAWFLNFQFVELRFLRPLRQVRLAKTGDAEKRMMVQELTLVVRQEAALGAAFDLTVA